MLRTQQTLLGLDIVSKFRLAVKTNCRDRTSTTEIPQLTDAVNALRSIMTFFLGIIQNNKHKPTTAPKRQCNRSSQLLALACHARLQGSYFQHVLSCHAIFLICPASVCVFMCVKQRGCKNALWQLLKHWPLQKNRRSVPNNMVYWEHACARALRVHMWHDVRPVTFPSHQPSLTLMYGQTSLCMVGCMIYRWRYNGVATVMNWVFDARASAGGREVNTTTVMAAITVLMLMMMVMKLPSSLADDAWGNFLEGEEEEEEEEEEEGRTKEWKKKKKKKQREEGGSRAIIGCSAGASFDVLTASHCWRKAAWVLMMMIINDDKADDGDAQTVFKVSYQWKSVEPRGVLVVKLGHPAGPHPPCLSVLEQC